MRRGFRKSLMTMTAIALSFATLSYAADTHKGMAVHSAMTMGHGSGMKMGHPQVAGPQGGHHSWKDSLTKAQNEKMEIMHLSIKRDLAPLKAELEFRKAQLKNLVTTKNPNMAAVNSKIKEISAIRAKVMTKRYAHIVEMRKVLTPLQRQAFDLDFISGVEHWRGHGRK